MKNQTILSIMVMLLMNSYAFSQPKIMKTDRTIKNINDISPVFNEHPQEERYKPDSMQTVYYSTNTDSIYVFNTLYSYDSTGRLILVRITSIYREEFIYNEINQLIEHKTYENDADNSADTILPTSKYVFSYDENNRLTKKCMFTGYSGAVEWNPDTSNNEEYAYNEEGIIDHTTIYGYGLDKQRMISSVNHYSYDKALRILTAVNEQFYNFDDQWRLEDSIIYHFNSDSLCTLVDSYLYNDVDSIWERTYQDEFSYDEEGKIQYEVYGSCWNGYFSPFFKFIYSYNTDGTLKQMAERSWNGNLQIWDSFFSFNYYYADSSETSLQNNTTDVKLYQKPVDNIQLDEIPDGSVIIVYNMCGIKVMQQTCSNGINPVTQLAKGMYVIHIIDKSKLLYNQVIYKNK